MHRNVYKSIHIDHSRFLVFLVHYDILAMLVLVHCNNDIVYELV